MPVQSLRELLCEALAQVISGALSSPDIAVITTTAGRPIPRGQVKTVVVDWTNEDCEHTPAMGAPLRQRRTLSLTVDSRLKAADSAVQEVSQLAAQVEAAVGANNLEVGGKKTEYVRFTGAVKSEDASGEHRLVVVSSLFQIGYRVNANQPYTMLD